MNICVFIYLHFGCATLQWNLSFPTRDQTMPSAMQVWSLNHGTAMDVTVVNLCLKLNVNILPMAK